MTEGKVWMYPGNGKNPQSQGTPPETKKEKCTPEMGKIPKVRVHHQKPRKKSVPRKWEKSPK